MRVLKLLGAFFLGIIVLLIIGFFAMRMITTYRATGFLKDTVRDLQRVAANREYTQRCITLVGDTSSGAIYQLRFTSDTEFRLEAVCEELRFQPLTIETYTLPQFVTKAPGTSGIVLRPEQPGSVTLIAFERLEQFLSAQLGLWVDGLIAQERTVYIEDNRVADSSERLNLGLGPVSNCAGYGYQCCQRVSEQGVGDDLSGVLDCDGSCYESCAPLPVVLSFNSVPLPEGENRSISIRSGETVNFGYVVDVQGSDTFGVLLDFGDGTQEFLEEPEGKLEHTYTCENVSCSYQASVGIVYRDSRESASVQTENTMITVNVRP